MLQNIYLLNMYKVRNKIGILSVSILIYTLITIAKFKIYFILKFSLSDQKNSR